MHCKCYWFSLKQTGTAPTWVCTLAQHNWSSYW